MSRSASNSSGGQSTASIPNGQWIKNKNPLCPGGLVYKDFFPLLDPDKSTCCTKHYATFSETVQTGNEWLSLHEGCEVVACESLPFSLSGQTATLVPDSWPTTTHLRGLRIWIRESGNIGAAGSSTLPRPRSNSRVLLSYRDFSPYIDGKSMFTSDYEDVNVLLGRVNSYLADRATAAKVISLQTIDTPMDGLLDVEADTEKSTLTFTQHGYTRYCRSLRVFSVTKYKRANTLAPLNQPTVGIKDFSSDNSSNSESQISNLIKSAMKWCSAKGVTILNLQVLNLRTGESNTAASTWLLESPGHIPNKFTSFVRLAFILQPGSSPDILQTSPVPSVLKENRERGGDVDDGVIKEDNAVSKNNQLNKSKTNPSDVDDMPGVISASEKRLTTHPFGAVHCKVFVPRLNSAGGLCGKPEWESLDQTISRLNSWASASQGKILSIHTQYLYFSGSEIDAETTTWVRYMSGGKQIGVIHVVVSGGIPPTALPGHPTIQKSKCSIM